MLLKRKRLVILAMVAASIFVLFFIDWQREREVYSAKEDREKEEIPLLDLEGVNLVGWSKEGEKSWEVKADSGVQFSESLRS